MSLVGLCRAEFRFIQGGNQAEFHIDFVSSDPVSIPMLETVGSGLANWCVGEIVTHLTHEITLVEVFMKSLDPALPAEVTVTDGLPHAGDDANAGLSAQTALLVSFVTEEISPTGRGRVFIPGIGVDRIANYLFNATLTASIDAAFAALLVILDGSPLTWVVYSVKDAVAREIVAWVVRNIPAGLNKRRIGRGS